MNLWLIFIIAMNMLLLIRRNYAFQQFRISSAAGYMRPTLNLLSQRFGSRSLSLENEAAAVGQSPVGKDSLATSSPRRKKTTSSKSLPTPQQSVQLDIDPKLTNHPILSILNEHQIRAATSLIDRSYSREDFLAAPLTKQVPKVTMVLAGAGSGKTRVLVHRMAYLLQELKVNPNAILATTFTNKAAREIKERIQALLYPDVTNYVTPGVLSLLEEAEPEDALPQWLGTFHSLCYKLLLYNSQLASMEGCNMIDEAQQRVVVKKLIIPREKEIDALKLDHDVALKRCIIFINRCKDHGLRAHATNKNFDPEYVFYQSAYEAYEEHCRAEKLLDFNEVLLRTYELFRRQPKVLERYRRQFQYIHVDEFQDTNSVQYGIIKQLIDGPERAVNEPANQGPSLFVVGDDDQAIYGFRGAKVDIMQQVRRDYPESALIKLEQNYRSTHTILRAANSVIYKNKIRLGKSLWTIKDHHKDEKVYVCRAENEHKEAEYVASEILKRTSDGPDGSNRKTQHMRSANKNEKRDFSLSDIAILVRTRLQIIPLESALLRNGIPYRIRGGHNFYQREEVQNVLMYLKLVENRHNNVAFSKVVNFPARGVTTKLLAEVEAIAQAESMSLWDAAVAVTQRAMNPVQSSEEALSTSSSGSDSGSDSEEEEASLTKSAEKEKKQKKPKKVKVKAVPKTIQHLAEFLRTVDHIHALIDRLPVNEAVKIAITQSGVHAYYVTGALKPTKQAEVYERKVEHLGELAALVDERVNPGVDDTSWIDRYSGELQASSLDVHRASSEKRDALNRTQMQVFLDEISFDEDHSDKASDAHARRAVQVFTIHGVKGLEFPVVFLCGAEEGILPYRNIWNASVSNNHSQPIRWADSLEPQEQNLNLSDDEDLVPQSGNVTSSALKEGLEESRRLFYVALTRARELLYITHAATRTRAQDPFPSKVSRSMFLDELDQDVVTKVELAPSTFDKSMFRKFVRKY